MDLRITPLTPTIGAEVEGADLLDLDEDQFDQIFDAFIRHSVVFLRDQPALTDDQHLDFARRFGEIHIHPFERLAGVNAGGPSLGILRIRTTSESSVAAGNRWHSDVSCDEEPPQASILQLHRIPPVGGDTLFASLFAAYDALSPAMKRYLDGLTALHSGEDSYRKLFRVKMLDADATWPESAHPVVRRHVETGRPGLYIDREFTESISELPKEEARSLLDFLFQHTERVNFQCRFRWTENAIAIWDNRCVLHHAMWDYWPHERDGRRITVKGERPVMWRIDEDEVPSGAQSNAVRLTA